MSRPLPTSFTLGANRAFHEGPLTILVPVGDGGFDDLIDYLARRSADLGRPVLLMVVVRPGVKVDPANLRAQVTRLLEGSSDSLESVAVAIDGHGFFASTFMSIASMLFIQMRKAKTPMRVFKSLDDAVAYGVEVLDAPWVGEFAAQVRATLPAPK